MISQIPPSNNSEQLGRIVNSKKALFISAHPDDVEFYCGALVYMLRKRGVDVVFAIGTRGGKGYRGRCGKYLEQLRSRYQMDAADILGGARVIFYEYPDKELHRYIEPFTHELISLIGVEKPDIIFSWDPDYISNPHLDHQAAAQAGKIASKGHFVCYFGTGEPNLLVGYDEDVNSIKLKALRAHRTEVPWFYYPKVKRIILKRTQPYGAEIGTPYAEALRCPNAGLHAK